MMKLGAFALAVLGLMGALAIGGLLIPPGDAVAPAAEPEPVAGTARLAPEEVARLAHSCFRGFDLVIAIAVAGAESGWRADAVGDLHLMDETWGPSIGLWQVRSQWAQRGTGGIRDMERLLDPAFNASSACALRATPRGWDHWTAYTARTYETHLPRALQAAFPFQAEEVQ